MVGYAKDDRRRAQDDRHIACMGEACSQSFGELIAHTDSRSCGLQRWAGISFDRPAVGNWIRHRRQKLKIKF
jgi:hypothetical protein